MNDILKQRLVGALILVALGVVFWPIIFVEPGDQAVAEQRRIPPRPEVVTTAIEAPDLAGLRASPELAVPLERVSVICRAIGGLDTWTTSLAERYLEIEHEGI